MSTLTLRVHVKEANVEEEGPDSSVQAVLRIGSTSFSTRKAHTPKPQWNEDFVFTVNDPNGSLTVELRKPKMFQPKLLGLATIPLYSVRHSNKQGEGHWSCLFLPTPTGSLKPTQHQIHLDTHFEFPKDIPEDLAEALDRKLQNLDDVLEKELEVLEEQNRRLIVGELTPPSKEPGMYTYTHSPTSVTLPSISSTKTSSTTSPLSSPSPSPPVITVTAPQHMPRRHSGASSSSSSSGSAPPHSSDPTPPRKHRRRKLKFDSQDGESRSLSESLSPSLRRSSPVLSSKFRSSPSRQEASRIVKHTLEQFVSHQKVVSVEGGGGKSADREQQMVVEQGRLIRHKWHTIIKKPDFQKQMLALQEERVSSTNGGPPHPTPRGHLTELMNQLNTTQWTNLGGNKVDFYSSNSEFQCRSKSMIQTKKMRMKEKHLIDEGLKMRVYKRTMEALVYPASAPNAHKFSVWTAHKPTMCSVCDSLLWGLSKQGVKCATCGKICHERCASLATKECFYTDKHSSIDSHITAVLERIHKTVSDNTSMFALLRDAFNVPQGQHEQTIQETAKKILEKMQNFKARVTVKVIAASGLNLTKVSVRRVYVTVDVADSMQRTTIFKADRNPQWNEEFKFTTTNYHEQIKIRVWNCHSAMIAMVAKTMTKEGDHFLGERIIDLRTVSAPVNVWYKLLSRTKDARQQVSGSLLLNLSSNVEGEDLSTPFYQQYLRLHELMFSHVHLVLNFPLLFPEEAEPAPDVSSLDQEHEDEKHIMLLPGGAQDIINEFALRYSIEPIYKLMCHMSLLVNHHSLEGALQAMDSLLKSLKYHLFMHVAADNSIRAVGAKKLLEEQMDSCNFGRDNFARLLGDKLLSSLRLDLQQYRELYPSNDPGKLEELKLTCQLITTVVLFRQQIMADVEYQIEDLISDSMKECFQKTFYFVVQNSMPKESQEEDQSHPGLSKDRPPFQFFYEILDQLRAVVYEDRTVYEPIISQFCSFSLGDVSALDLWGMFGATIQDLFETKANQEVFPPNEYIKLYFAVKSFYESAVANVPSRVGVTPEYPHWFLPSMLHWMQEYQKNAEMFISNAWEDDKETFKFAPYEEQTFSSSNYQMFFVLHKGFEMIETFQPQETELRHTIAEEFALIIQTVVQHYVDNVSMHLPECVDNLEQACMLLNNLQALRVNVQSLYEEMGGSETTGPGATEILHQFQVSVLAKELSSWCVFVARSLTPEILNKAKVVHNKFLRLSQGDVKRREVKDIIGPLMDMLTKKIRVIATICEPLVIQKILKEVWHMLLEMFYHMLLPKLHWEGGGAQAEEGVEFPQCYYSPQQCSAFEMALDMIKEFFTEDKLAGIKPSTIDRGIKQLSKVIGLYRQTTETLIAEFIIDATGQATEHMDTTCGEVSMEVEAYRHPATGELDGTIRVISASNLKPFAEGGVLRTAIEITLMVPHFFGSKKKFTTAVKSGSNSPKFNETFQFTLPQWENCELQVTAKNVNRLRLGSDKVIGVAVVLLATVLKEASVTVSLGPGIRSSERGQALLYLLSVRTNDDNAKEFVAFKSQHRSSFEEEARV